MAKITDPDQLADSAADDNSEEVYINTSTKTIKLVVVGNLSNTGVQNENGVTLKALYSFLKEEWKNDPNSKNLAAFPFPLVPITDESFEFVDGWDLLNDTGRYLIRDAGWTVKNNSALTTQKWAGVIGLGSIETNDQLYFYNGAGTGTNFQLTGQVNQAVQILKDDDGDGNTAEGADFDRRTTFNLYCREYSQIYGKSSLSDIGVTTMDSIAYRFPISTSTDLNIEDTDGNVVANSPFTQIAVRYFDQAFVRDVDTAGVGRSFGIVVDVGTHSGVDGSVASGATLTTAEGAIAGATYAGGTLVVHEGTSKGTYTISGTPTSTVVTITTTFPATEGNLSFTLQRATPITATAEEIYTKVNYLLRQAADMDSTDQSVPGKTADELLEFVGSDLKVGRKIPTNPNGGGTGVIVEGFAANDTNRIAFYDNSSTVRTYPFVATLTLNFGDNLVDDADAKYWVYFTTLPGSSNDYGEAGALIIDDAVGSDMSGLISAQASITRTFAYSTNVQGGRTAATDAEFTAIAIGLNTGQYVRATGTIFQATTNSVTLVAPLERQYDT